MDKLSDSFGYWLRRRRLALDLTQVALAEKVSCSQAAIKKIEAQERRPSVRLAQRLADQLGVPAHEREAFLAAARSFSAAQHLPRNGFPLPAIPLRRAPAASGQDRLPGSPPAGLSATHPLLVGRDSECRHIDQALEGLPQHGRVLLLQGEAGIGKSRLLDEALAGAQRRGMPALATNCYEIERAIAYQPVIDLATQAVARVPVARLDTLAPVLLAELAALVPALAARIATLPALSIDRPEARQARLFNALLQLVDAIEGPLLLVVDNLQWADDASLTFVHFLARQVATRPVLLACTFRDEELVADDRLAALLESLRREPHTLHLMLARLDAQATGALLVRINDPALADPDLARRLHRETGGNPFFLWSILHSLGEGAPRASDISTLPLPDSLRDSVRARLAWVPPAQRPLLELAAVLGRRFEFETLLALAGVAESTCVDALDALVKRGLLQEDQEGGYDFSHDKLREVVYLDTGAARRVLLHRQVAELLERTAVDSAQSAHARLAEHYERGKVWPRAVHYLALAADRSQKLFAMAEALRWFDRAVALLQAHPDAALPGQLETLHEHRGLARAQAGQIEGAVVDLQLVIGSARARGEHEHARDLLIQLGMAYRRADAHELALTCLDEALTASRASGDERHVADTLYHVGTVAWSNGRNDLALAHHHQAVEICERLALSDLVAVQAFHGVGEALFANAQPVAAVAAFERSLALARRIDDKSYEAENLLMIGWGCTGHMGLADFLRSLSHFDESLAISRAADLQWHLGPALIGRACVRAALGRYGEAWHDLNEALPRLEVLRLVRYQLMAHDAMGCVLLDLGQPAEALPHFERGLGLAADAGIRYWLPRLLANRELARLGVGQLVDRASLATATGEAQDHCEGWVLLRCLQAQAELALADGDAAAGLQHAERLLALAQAGGMKEQVAHAHRLRGLARFANHALEAAHEELSLALERSEQIGQLRLQLDCQWALAAVAMALGDPQGATARRAGAAEIAGHIERSLAGSGLACGLSALGQSLP